MKNDKNLCTLLVEFIYLPYIILIINSANLSIFVIEMENFFWEVIIIYVSFTSSLDFRMLGLSFAIMSLFLLFNMSCVQVR
jgi:hypothetical protein